MIEILVLSTRVVALASLVLFVAWAVRQAWGTSRLLGALLLLVFIAVPLGARHWLTANTKPRHILWKTEFSDGLTEYADNIDLDQNGNIYVAGFDQTRARLTIRKYNKTGKRLWIRRRQVPLRLLSTILVDKGSGHLYAVGLQPLPNPLRAAVHVSKYTREGDLVWEHVLDNELSILILDAAVAADGSIYLAGAAVPAASGDDVEANDAYVAKIDPQGNLLWISVLGGPGRDVAFAIAADKSGHAYAAGNASGALPNEASSAPRDAFVVKYDPAGTVQWTTRFDSRYTPRDIVADSKDNLVVAGTVSGQIAEALEEPHTQVIRAVGHGVLKSPDSGAFVARFDSSGERQWTRVSDGAAAHVTVDSRDSVYVVGDRSWIQEAAQRKLEARAFVHKYAPNGTRRSAVEFIHGRTNGATMDARDNLFVSGALRRSVMWGPMFLAKVVP